MGSTYSHIRYNGHTKETDLEGLGHHHALLSVVGGGDALEGREAVQCLRAPEGLVGEHPADLWVRAAVVGGDDMVKRQNIGMGRVNLIRPSFPISGMGWKRKTHRAPEDAGWGAVVEGAALGVGVGALAQELHVARVVADDCGLRGEGVLRLISKGWSRGSVEFSTTTHLTRIIIHRRSSSPLTHSPNHTLDSTYGRPRS